MSYFSINKIKDNQFEFVISREQLKVSLPVSRHEIEALITSLTTMLVDNESEIDYKIKISKERIQLLANLSPRNIQAWLREISSENLIVVVKLADHMNINGFRQNVLANMSKRAADMLQDDVDMKGPISINDAWDNLTEIFETADRMNQDGEIYLYDTSGYI